MPKRYKHIKNLSDAPYVVPKILNVITMAQPGIDVINGQIAQKVLACSICFRCVLLSIVFRSTF